MLGVASAAVQVSTFSRAHKAVDSQGYLDDMDTYLNLTGSWTFSFYAGMFLGPTVGGFLVEAYDFQTAIYLYLVIYGLLVVMDGFMLIKDCCQVQKG